MLLTPLIILLLYTTGVIVIFDIVKNVVNEVKSVVSNVAFPAAEDASSVSVAHEKKFSVCITWRKQLYEVHFTSKD